MQSHYSGICGQPQTEAILRSWGRVSIITYAFVPMLTLNPIVLTLTTQVCIRAIFASKVFCCCFQKALGFFYYSFLLIFLLLLDGMSPKQDIPNCPGRQKRENEYCLSPSTGDHMTAQELSKMLHACNYTTQPNGSADMQVSKQAFQTHKKALQPCCYLLVRSELEGKDMHMCCLTFLLCLQAALLKTFSPVHLFG